MKNISNVQVHKRTFEGETDPSKNDNPITSKYYRSCKFAVSYNIEGYEHLVVTCKRTKKDAIAYVEKLKGGLSV